MDVPPFGAAIKPLNALVTLRLVDGKPTQPGMGAPTQRGTPLGRAPIAPFPSPALPADGLAVVPVMRMLLLQAAHEGR